MRKIFLSVILSVALVLSLASCQLLFGDNNSAEPEGFIFDADSDLTIIFADPALGDELTNKIYNAVAAARGGNAPDFGSASIDQSKHEIVIGRSDRPVSTTAYLRLEQLDDEDGANLRYVIYSDGSSIAIAYDEDKYDTAVLAVIDLFLSEYLIGETLTVKAGVSDESSFSIYEYWSERDKIEQASQWEKVENALGDAGHDIVAALKVLYTNYDTDVLEWLASLYAPRVCVCENYDANGNKVCLYPKDAEGNYLCSGGGFYYSVSALETPGYLPDIVWLSQMTF